MLSLKLTKLAAAALAATILAGSAGTAFADTPWEMNHQRRDEVNDRLRHQDHRIDRERRDGEIGRGQAREMHREDRHIRGEERHMASRDGGHITRRDQHMLNRQENHVGHHFFR
jgi:hypothetical protein